MPVGGALWPADKHIRSVSRRRQNPISKNGEKSDSGSPVGSSHPGKTWPAGITLTYAHCMLNALFLRIFMQLHSQSVGL